MCRVPVSCADFKAILKPFSEVIENRCFSFKKTKRRENGFKIGARDKYATLK